MSRQRMGWKSKLPNPLEASRCELQEALQNWLSQPIKDDDEAMNYLKGLFFGDLNHGLIDALQFVQKSITYQDCYNLFMDYARFNVVRHSFLETEQSYMGLAPELTQIGNEVYVLPGLNVPFVMRCHKSYYEMVGPCFILGYMDGEAMALVEAGKPRFKILKSVSVKPSELST